MYQTVCVCVWFALCQLIDLVVCVAKVHSDDTICSASLRAMCMQKASLYAIRLRHIQLFWEIFHATKRSFDFFIK